MCSRIERNAENTVDREDQGGIMDSLDKKKLHETTIMKRKDCVF